MTKRCEKHLSILLHFYDFLKPSQHVKHRMLLLSSFSGWKKSSKGFKPWPVPNQTSSDPVEDRDTRKTLPCPAARPCIRRIREYSSSEHSPRRKITLNHWFHHLILALMLFKINLTQIQLSSFAIQYRTRFSIVLKMYIPNGFVRVAKGILVTRDGLFCPVKCETANFFVPWNVKRLTFLSEIVIFKVAVKRNFLKLFSLKRQMNV